MYSLLRLCLALALNVSLPVFSAPAHAAEDWAVPVDQGEWRTLRVPGARENQFRLRGDTLQVVSENSISFRYHELSPTIANPAYVSWLWRVDGHTSVSSQTRKGADDRPLAVHIWFDDGEDQAMLRRLSSALDRPRIGHLLTYVWGAVEPAGSVLANPYYDKGRVIVLVGDNGTTGEWRAIRRNIAEDFARAFGTAPDLSTLRYVAISADTDDLKGKSTAAVRALAFHVK